MNNYITKSNFLVDCYASIAEQAEKIDKFIDLLENSGVFEFIKVNTNISDNVEQGGRPRYNPYRLLTLILYNFAFGNGKLRDIEERCKYDLRCMYIMNNKAPTHMTIGSFINDYILPNQAEIFSIITNAIFKFCSIKMDKMYIDGSKFEANANKYKFVWKPTTYHIRLSDKVRLLLKKYDIMRGISSEGIIDSKIIANKVIELHEYFHNNNIDLQLKTNKLYSKDYYLLLNYLEKSLEYEEKERICGPNRNSYYKTDYDATAMCLKEDYYSGLGSNMHAAYNTQIAVCYGFITTYLVTQSRNDLYDFIPLLKQHFNLYNVYPISICADSGYGSLDNYKFLDKNNIKNFVKYSTWEGNVSGKRPSQYKINIDDTITCLNGNIGYVDNDTSRHHKKSNSTFYKIDGCNDCDFSLFCKRFMKDKTEDLKIFEVSSELQKFIQQAEDNLLSVEGIEMRVNRSAQVEGAFGIIKQNLNYDRFRRRKLLNVSAEFMLVCLGYNIRKLFKHFDGNLKLDYWKAPVDIKPETFKKPSAKRLCNSASKIKKKSPNETARTSYKYTK